VVSEVFDCLWAGVVTNYDIDFQKKKFMMVVEIEHQNTEKETFFVEFCGVDSFIFIDEDRSWERWAYVSLEVVVVKKTKRRKKGLSRDRRRKAWKVMMEFWSTDIEIICEKVIVRKGEQEWCFER